MKRRRFVALWLPVAAYLVLLYILSDRSGLPVGFSAWDKFLHAGAYGMLGVLSLRAFHGGLGRVRWLPTVGALVLTVGYGAFDEFHQSFVTGRHADLWDLAADSLGAVLAVGTVTVVFGRGASRELDPDALEVTLVECDGCPECEGALSSLKEARKEVPFRLVRRPVRDETGAGGWQPSDAPLVFLGGRLILKGHFRSSRVVRLLEQAAKRKGYNPPAASRTHGSS